MVALAVIGFLAFIVGAVMLLVSVLRKKKLRTWGIVMGVSLVVMVLGAALSRPNEKITPGTQELDGSSVADLGKTRDNPIPVGSRLQYGDMELTVLGLERQANIGWLCSADEGKEYAVATIRLRNLGSPNETKRYSAIDFRMVGSKAKIYDHTYCTTNNPLESGELFGGGIASGEVVCEVDSDDTLLVLIWSADWGESRYFSLE